MEFLNIESRISPILDNMVSIIKEHEIRYQLEISSHNKVIEDKQNTINLLSEKTERQKEEMDDFLKVSFATKWKKKCEESEGHKSRLEDKLEALQRINIELNHRLDQFSKQDSISTQTDTIEEQVCDERVTQELKKKYEKIEKTNKATQKKNRELTNKVNELRKNLDSITIEYGNNTSAIELLSNVEIERDNLKIEVEKLKELNTENTEKNINQEEFKEKIDELNKQLNVSLNESRKFKEQVVTFEDKLLKMEYLQIENKELREDITTCKDKISKDHTTKDVQDTSELKETISKLETINAKNYDLINDLEINLGNKQCEMTIKTSKGGVYKLKDKELIKDGKIVGNVVETKLI